MQQRRPATDLHQTFIDIMALLEHHRTLEALAENQDRSGGASPVQLQERQNAAELQRRFRGLHPADLGFVLEGLEPDDRLRTWAALDPRQAAEAIVEVDGSVRAWLIGETRTTASSRSPSRSIPMTWRGSRTICPRRSCGDVRASIGEVGRTLLQQADAYPPNRSGV